MDERRRVVGLIPLDEGIRSCRESMARSTEKPPANWAERQRKFEQ